MQRLLFAPQTWFGVTQPIDAAQTYVLGPLASVAPTNPALAAALATYNAASADQQNKWTANYEKAVANVKFVNGTPVLPAGNYGPVPVMLATELTLARSGAIDADLSAPSGSSTAPTSPSRCSSSRTAATTWIRRPPVTSPATSGA